jgi:hypothetical protein
MKKLLLLIVVISFGLQAQGIHKRQLLTEDSSLTSGTPAKYVTPTMLGTSATAKVAKADTTTHAGGSYVTPTQFATDSSYRVLVEATKQATVPNLADTTKYVKTSANGVVAGSVWYSDSMHTIIIKDSNRKSWKIHVNTSGVLTTQTDTTAN